MLSPVQITQQLKQEEPCVDWTDYIEIAVCLMRSLTLTTRRSETRSESIYKKCKVKETAFFFIGLWLPHEVLIGYLVDELCQNL